MSRRALMSSRTMLAFAFFAGFVLQAGAATDARLSESYGKLPLQFEANHGQTDKQVRFLSRGVGYNLYLTAGEAVLVLSKPAADARGVALRMSLVGAARKPSVSGLDELPGKANYFIGKDRSKWRTNVPTYAKVHYQNVYPGIDLVYYGNQRQLEYDFVVAPGADPKKIGLGFRGADKLEIDAQGDLVLHAAGGDLRQHKPVIYQDIDGVRQEVAGGYVRKGANRVGFTVAAYDTSRPLVIDPLVLSYSTYLGGSDSDGAGAIALDAAGNAYVTGGTFSTDFPTTAGAFQPTHSGGAFVSSDAFVTKLNSTGSALIYSTYLGGRGVNFAGEVGVHGPLHCGNDGGNGIAVDADGNAYVTGATNAVDFPTTPGAFQPIVPPPGPRCPDRAFVTKLSSAGLLLYSTYLGGSDGTVNNGNGIAVNASGNAYIVGQTDSRDFPTTPGAFQTTNAGNKVSNQFSNDAFVTIMNPTGSGLVYSTYLGGAGSDSGFGIAVDAGGNAYVTGVTGSPDFPTTPGAAFTSGSCCLGNVFITKLSPSSPGLVYSTYLGGGNGNAGQAIAVDAAGNAYVTGVTASDNFPTTPGAFQPSMADGEDVFVTKLNPSGSALVYSTYLSGSAPRFSPPRSFGQGIAVDTAGNAYITGRTESKTFPTTPDAVQRASRSAFGASAFVSKLDATGSTLVYSSYFDGNGDTSGNGIAVDGAGSIYVTGSALARDFPTTAGAFQPTFGAGVPGAFGFDAFITKISFGTRFEEDDPAVTQTPSEAWVPRGAEIAAFSAAAARSSDVAGATATFRFTGTTVSWFGLRCNVCGIATVSIDGGAPISVDTAGTAAPGSPGLVSQLVFAASNLGDGQHTLLVTVSGTTTSGGAHIVVDAFDVNATRSSDTTRSEESAATQIGFWTNYGAETGTFSGGSIVASNVIASTALFSFTGTAVSWIGVKCNVCGIAAVSVDGGLPTTVDTAGPNAPGGLASVSVFSASGLAAGNHTIAILVTGMSNSGGSYVALDAFDVTAGNAASPLLPSVALPPPPVTIPPLPLFLGL